jgi:hypothetical protein
VLFLEAGRDLLSFGSMNDLLSPFELSGASKGEVKFKFFLANFDSDLHSFRFCLLVVLLLTFFVLFWLFLEKIEFL